MSLSGLGHPSGIKTGNLERHVSEAVGLLDLHDKIVQNFKILKAHKRLVGSVGTFSGYCPLHSNAFLNPSNISDMSG